jgi:hypothetical protein
MISNLYIYIYTHTHTHTHTHTGPVTVPILVALGIGVMRTKNETDAKKLADELSEHSRSNAPAPDDNTNGAKTNGSLPPAFPANNSTIPKNPYVDTTAIISRGPPKPPVFPPPQYLTSGQGFPPYMLSGGPIVGLDGAVTIPMTYNGLHARSSVDAISMAPTMFRPSNELRAYGPGNEFRDSASVYSRRSSNDTLYMQPNELQAYGTNFGALRSSNQIRVYGRNFGAPGSLSNEMVFMPSAPGVAALQQQYATNGVAQGASFKDSDSGTDTGARSGRGGGRKKVRKNVISGAEMAPSVSVDLCIHVL